MLKWFKGLLSALLVFHLAAICLSPNQDSKLAHELAPLTDPYLHFLEITSPWSFFAPDPGPPPIYVEWEMLDRENHSFARGSFPERENPPFLRERLNRQIAAVEFMFSSDGRIEKMMTPYVCGLDPRAYSVNLWRTIRKIPSMEDVAEGKQGLNDEQNVERKLVAHDFCEKEAEK